MDVGVLTAYKSELRKVATILKDKDHVVKKRKGTEAEEEQPQKFYLVATFRWFDYSHVWASIAPAILLLYLEFPCQITTRLSGIQVLVFMPGSADCDLVGIKNMRYSIDTALINHLSDVLYPTDYINTNSWWDLLLASQTHGIDAVHQLQTSAHQCSNCNETPATSCVANRNDCTDAVHQLQTAAHQCSNCNGHTDSNFNLGPIPPHHTRNHQTSTNLPAPARSPYHQQTHCTACQRTKSSEHCTSATATYHPHLDLSCCTLTSTRLNWCSLHFTFGLRGKKHQQPRVSQAKTIALTLFISCKQQHTSAATVTEPPDLHQPARSPYHQQTHCTACQRTKSSEHCTSATATYNPHLDVNCCTLTSTRAVPCTLPLACGVRNTSNLVCRKPNPWH
eukprot:g75182.t1